MTVRYGLAALLLLSLVCCTKKPEKPDPLIPEAKYIDLLVELQLIRTYSQNSSADSTKIDSLSKEVFKKYEVSAETFQQSHRYYQEFPEEQKKRVEKAIEELKMDQVSDSTAPDERRPYN